MEQIKYYKKLYQLQDRVLKIIFKKNSSFYLTGGTALHRFFYQERYSDDLDMFSNASKLFSFEYKNILQTLTKNFSINIEIDGYGFKRLNVIDDDLILKVDFVNDMEYRVDMPEVKKGFVIDSIYNILTNKISAVLGRDEPKDIFDIITIWRKNEFSWSEIFQLTENKISFEIDEFLIRLQEFPIEMLAELKTEMPVDINNCQVSLEKIIYEINFNRKHIK